MSKALATYDQGKKRDARLRNDNRGTAVSDDVPEEKMKVTRSVHLVSNEADAVAAVKHIQDAGTKEIGLDHEGVLLGRFGRLCTLQFATDSRIYVCDALKQGVVNTVKPILINPDVTKVSSICALLHDLPRCYMPICSFFASSDVSAPFALLPQQCQPPILHVAYPFGFLLIKLTVFMAGDAWLPWR